MKGLIEIVSTGVLKTMADRWIGEKTRGPKGPGDRKSRGSEAIRPVEDEQNMLKP